MRQLHAPVEQIFDGNHLGDAAAVTRSSDLCEFEGGLLVQFSYNCSRKDRKLAVVNICHLACRLGVVGHDRKHTV